MTVWSPDIRNCAWCRLPMEICKGNFYIEKDSLRRRRYHVPHLREFLLQKIGANLVRQGKTAVEVESLVKSGVIDQAISKLTESDYEYIPQSEECTVPVSRFAAKSRIPTQSMQSETTTEVAVASYKRKKPQPQQDMSWLFGNIKRSITHA